VRCYICMSLISDVVCGGVWGFSVGGGGVGGGRGARGQGLACALQDIQ